MKKFRIFFILLFILFQTSKAQTWKPFGTSLSGGGEVVNDFLVYNNELYACGGFLLSGSDTLNGIARWDGTNWNPLGTGLHWGGGYCMAEYNNELILGGQFYDILGVPLAKDIARWNGSAWHSLASGIQSGNVRAMAVYQGNLYVGGMIQTIDSMPMKNIGKWDGTTWSLPCIINAGLTQIDAMTVFNNELYIGGAFYSVNSIPVYNIAKFDGTTWSGVGGGLNSNVWAFYPDTINNRLYAVGNFNLAAGGAVSCPSNVAYWDGSNWFAVGNGPAFYPRAVTMYKGELYVDAGNTFIMPSGDTINFIARWNGTDWKPLGSGVNCSVLALMEFNNELAVGGCFTQAGDTLASEAASWDYTPVSVNEIKNSKEKIEIVPNPFSTKIAIKFEKHSVKQTSLTIKNILGQTVFSNEVNKISSASIKTIDLSFLSKGIYLLDIIIDGERMVRKIVKE